MNRTLSIVKPDAVGKRLTGKVMARLEAAGLRLLEARMERLSKKQAEQFYREHSGRPFFSSLVEFMTSGPVMLLLLEGDGAVSLCRKLMGATNPAEAETGTIRADFAENIERNTVHGSDSPEAADREIAFFFPGR